MGAWSFEELRRHIGHEITCTAYSDLLGHVYNVAVECENCNEVLLDFDNPEPHPIMEEG